MGGPCTFHAALGQAAGTTQCVLYVARHKGFRQSIHLVTICPPIATQASISQTLGCSSLREITNLLACLNH